MPLGALLVVFSLFRVVFWLVFSRSAEPIAAIVLARVFYLGFKFDLRLALLLLVPIVVLSQLRYLDPTRNDRARRFWINHLALMATLLVAFYSIDLGNYAYLTERIDASALRYLRNPLISFGMVWETYPVLWASCGLVLFAIVFRAVLGWSLPDPLGDAPTVPGHRPWGRRVLLTVAVVAYLAGIYGKFSYYPLRWSDAFFSTNKFVSDLAVNPVLFFANTLSTAEGEVAYDIGQMSERYERVARYLGVESPSVERLDLARFVRPAAAGTPPPNIVLIFMESFAAHKTGAFGNPLNASPSLDALAEESLFFRKFYTPRRGTARGVFTTLTGIPDTITYQTASRNPRTITHHTILRAFEGYRKFYFLGGSANWANIRALLLHNHTDLEIFEEGSFEASRVDVWGIPDFFLFEEANRVLSTVRDAPFFAFIHLAGNHDPYTIPDGIPGFEVRDEDKDVLLENGFASIDEFNSFRLLDHSLGHFINIARDEAYFRNTLFVILSDNGDDRRSRSMPQCEETWRLGRYHVPLLIYAPGLISQGRIIDEMATQMDVMPTVAALAGIPTLNTTLGRNLLDPRFATHGVAFFYRTRGAVGEIGILDGEWALLVAADGTNTRLHRCTSGTQLQNLAEARPDRARDMKELALGLYHASKYLLYNNPPARFEENGLAVVNATPRGAAHTEAR